MLMEDAIMGATQENYENLMYAIIYQACCDYAGPDRDPNYEKPAARFLLDPENPYCAYLGIDGKRLIKQMNKNYYKYGKTLLSPTDLDELKKYGRILSPEERKLVKKQKKKNSNAKLYNFKKETK